jgi:16S rRNA G966 N2-methylase RsmD
MTGAIASFNEYKIPTELPAAESALEVALTRVRSASTYDELKRAKRFAAAVRELWGHVEEIRRKAELVIVMAGWRAGQKAIEVGRGHGVRGKKEGHAESLFSTPTLTEMFGDKARGKRLRALGKIETEVDLNELVRAVHGEEKEATITSVLRLKRQREREGRKANEADAARKAMAGFEIIHAAIENVGPDLLANDSVEAIVTDPPYPAEFLPVYSHLADFAARVLKPSGWCVVMLGNIFLPEILDRLRVKLEYRWQFAVTTPGGPHARISSVGVFQTYKPVLLFQKLPKSKMREWWPDLIVAKAAEQDKSLHRWQQSEAVFSTLVERFTLPGNLVVDPFAGSGTTGRAAIALGRNFWGCDVDPQCVTEILQAAE